MGLALDLLHLHSGGRASLTLDFLLLRTNDLVLLTLYLLLHRSRVVGAAVVDDQQLVDQRNSFLQLTADGADQRADRCRLVATWDAHRDRATRLCLHDGVERAVVDLEQADTRHRGTSGVGQ